MEVSKFVTEPAEAVRASWEARAVRMACLDDLIAATPVDKTGMCVLSVIAHRLSIEDLQFVLRCCGFRGTSLPMLTSAAKVAKTGHIMADFLTRDQCEYKNQALFRNTRQMETAFRNFADLMHMTDEERVEFFDSVKRWVVCDYRLDPTMDAADPDAKRLTVN